MYLLVQNGKCSYFDVKSPAFLKTEHAFHHRSVYNRSHLVPYRHNNTLRTLILT